MNIVYKPARGRGPMTPQELAEALKAAAKGLTHASLLTLGGRNLYVTAVSVHNGRLTIEVSN